MAATESDKPGLVPFIINGADYVPETTFDVVSPVTGKIAHQCGAASVADAAAAVDAAAEAFKTWRKTTPAQCRDIFLRASATFQQRHEELAQCMSDETGASPQWSAFNVNLAGELTKDIAGRVATIEGIFPPLGDPDTSGVILREPYGVILAVAPWNAPYILGTRSVAFPVAAGNTIVLKASELAPRTMRNIVSIFQEAGLPKGVMNVIAHEPAAAAEVTAALISNPLVKKINFTGSTGVGRIIGRLAGENLKPVLLELGGKSPVIVWEDADLDLAAQSCAIGSLENSGQICMCTERILVHKAVKAQFQENLKAAIDKLYPASGAAPVLINEAAVKKNKALVDDAISKGATVIHGNINAREISGTRLRPIVLDNVTPEMEIYETETFGPTVFLYEIETEEEAIQIANDTEYGLTSAVFTEDLRRGLRFAREIETGAVHINSMTIHDESVLPHGGAKSSGHGRFNSSAGLGEWVRTKTITFVN